MPSDMKRHITYMAWAWKYSNSVSRVFPYFSFVFSWKGCTFRIIHISAYTRQSFYLPRTTKVTDCDVEEKNENNRQHVSNKVKQYAERRLVLEQIMANARRTTSSTSSTSNVVDVGPPSPVISEDLKKRVQFEESPKGTRQRASTGPMKLSTSPDHERYFPPI